MKTLAGVLVVVVVILAGWAWSRHERAANEHALAGVASELAGRRVGVECQGFWAEMVDINNRSGDVPYPPGRVPDHMYLTRKICLALKHFRTASSHPQLDCLSAVDWSSWTAASDLGDPCTRHALSAANAVNTLTHESMHLRGFVNEAQAQCYAIQFDASTVVRLGGTPAQGAALARFVLALQPLLPEEYQSSDCRAGGGLDLHPETYAFPTEAAPSLPPPSLHG